MKSDSWSSFQAALPPEARAGGEPDDWPGPVEHGKTCEKITHHGRGYLHDADDDRPYDVDGVWYCGRCHTWMGWVT